MSVPPSVPPSVASAVSPTKDSFGNEVIRHWDPHGKYQDALLKVYSHWSLEVSFLQHTLGCYIIFCRRPVQRISQLLPEELLELGAVNGEIETVLERSSVFAPDRFNYLQMGNALHHLHFHGIPRYQTARYFAGSSFVDGSYGHPPIWTSVETSRDLVIEIRNAILPNLSGH